MLDCFVEACGQGWFQGAIVVQHKPENNNTLTVKLTNWRGELFALEKEKGKGKEKEKGKEGK